LNDTLEFDLGDNAADPGTPSDDAGEPSTYNRKVSKLEREELEAQAFWKTCLSHPLGRRELWKILSKGHAFKRDRFLSSQTGFPDPNATWFLLGMQDYAEALFYDWQKLDPHGVLLMQQEHDSRFARPKHPKPKRGE